jgi:hypothetical protein
MRLEPSSITGLCAALTVAVASATTACHSHTYQVLAPSTGAYVCVDSKTGALTQAGDAIAKYALVGGSGVSALEGWQLIQTNITRPGVSNCTVARQWLAPGGERATVVDFFGIGAHGSVRWSVGVSSNASAPVGVRLRLGLSLAPGNASAFWLAQNSPGIGQPGVGNADPLAWLPLPASPATWTYGGAIMTWASAREAAPGGEGVPVFPEGPLYGAGAPVPGFSLPLLSLRAPPGVPRSLALVGDLTEAPAHMNMSLAGASFALDRFYVRVGGGAAPLAFGQDLVTGQDDWRAALAWVVAAYPAHLGRAAGVNYTAIDGGVAYADFRGEALNASFLDDAGFALNWDATFPQSACSV